MKKCPYCAEQIQDEAIVCRFCNRELAPAPPLPSVDPNTQVTVSPAAPTAPVPLPSRRRPVGLALAAVGFVCGFAGSNGIVTLAWLLCGIGVACILPGAFLVRYVFGFIVGTFLLLPGVAVNPPAQNARAPVESSSPRPATPAASATPKTPATSAASRGTDKDAACRQDLQCWGDKHSIAAGVYCKDKVEALAQYSAEWTDGFLEPKFSRFRWKDKELGVVTYIGDKVKFQNGFGAWQNMVYECDLEPVSRVVIDVRVQPGRLPS